MSLYHLKKSELQSISIYYELGLINTVEIFFLDVWKIDGVQLSMNFTFPYFHFRGVQLSPTFFLSFSIQKTNG